MTKYKISLPKFIKRIKCQAVGHAITEQDEDRLETTPMFLTKCSVCGDDCEVRDYKNECYVVLPIE